MDKMSKVADYFGADNLKGFLDHAVKEDSERRIVLDLTPQGGLPPIWMLFLFWPLMAYQWALAGLFAVLADPQGPFLIAPKFRQFFMIGVCGGYTTFSSFSLQTLDLAQDGDWLKAAWNCAASLIGCLVAVWLGRVFGLALLTK